MFPFLNLIPILSSIGPAVASFLPALFDSIKKYWQYYLIALLLGSTSLTTYEWRHTGAELKTEKAAHAADIKSYHDAQAKAQKKADAEKAALTKQAKDQANAADKSYSTLYATYHANLLRFQASQGTGSGSSGGQLGAAPSSADGPSSDSLVSKSTITITTDDANICTVNTARLQAAHDWALQLKADNDKVNKTNGK